MRLDIERIMERKGMSENVRARIRRLNPNPQEGEMIRGWHPTRPVYLRCERDEISKGHFLRKYGRAAFEALPRYCIRKEGRRVFLPYMVQHRPGLKPL